MFFQSALFRVAPASGKLFDWFGRNWLTVSYYRWWTSTKNCLIEYHRRELKKLDRSYAMREAEHDLVNAREAALKVGIGPDHPKYPDLLDFMEI